MNQELVNELKQRYREFLTTREGREYLQVSVRLKTEWKKRQSETGMVSVKTAGVKLGTIHSELRKKISLLEIIPIGLNNQCFKNSAVLCDSELGISSVIGFNLTGCPCGKFLGYEFHSVNKIDGKLADFTRDFNDEPSKYFLELNTKTTPHQFKSVFGKTFYNIDKGCKCGIVWNKSSPEIEFLKEQEFIDLVRNIETIKIY
jgi:hypothetical protein